MPELTMERLRRRIEEGSNPVEVAGYGRESTHKGYLSWLLNTRHWPQAKEALIRLVKAAERPDYRGVKRWIEQCPDELWCEYERPMGKSRKRKKIDLLVRGKNGDDHDALPIELKTDTVAGRNQLRDMSDGSDLDTGLILLLGSSAVRDPLIPKDAGIFLPLTTSNILDAWDKSELSLPQPGKDWLESLRHERLRLDCAFDLTREQRGAYWRYGYRSCRDLLYALLNSVRNVLDQKYCYLGTWSLYDRPHNTVLNLNYGDWTPVADNNVRAYWEFNDKSLVFRVRTSEQDKIAREWIDREREKIRKSETSWPVKYKFPRTARRNSESMSVVK